MKQLLFCWFITVVWSRKIDVEYRGLEKTVVLLYKHKQSVMFPLIFQRSSILYPAYLCSHDFRKNNLPNSNNIDFDELAKTYAKCYLQVLNFKSTDPIWMELYGNKDELKLQKFSGLQVELTMNDVTFSKKNTMSSNVELSLRNVVDNSRSGTNVNSKVEHTVEKVTTSTSTTTHSCSHSGSIEFGVKDPITESGGSVKLSIFGSQTQGASESDSDKVIYKLTDSSTVPDHKVGRLIWTKSEIDIEMDWNSYIEVNGWIALRLDTVSLFIPVADMAYIFSEYVTRLDVNTVGLKVSGKLQMADSVVSEAVIDEFDFSKKNINCPDEMTNFTLPNSLIY